MRIGVTGGSGDIGRYVCDELLSQGCEVFSLDVRRPAEGVSFRQADLMSLAATRDAVRGCEQVIHLAAIPDPFQGHLPEEVLGRNTVLAFNVFEAARLESVPRVVYGCSESSTGFGIHEVKLRPLYLPIDEEHEMRPHECYSVSKYLGERIGACYAAAYGLEVISLRYTAVWLRRVAQTASRLVADARQGTDLRNLDEKDWLGGHIAVRDVARACAAATRFTFPERCAHPFDAFFLSARDTFFSLPTLDVMKAVFGVCPPVRDPEYFADNPFASVFDIRKARRLMSWEPRWAWRDFEEWEL